MPKGLKGFKKGYTPWNKGKKLPYPIWNKNKKCPSISKKLKGRKLSIETRLKMAKRIPWNKGKTGTYTTVIRFLIGSKRIRIDNGKKRRWIKIAQPNKWIQFSHYVYQKLTGKNTYNQIIHHKDENSLNDNFKNLQLVNRTEHMNLHRNKYLTHNIGRKHSKQICLNQSIRIKKWWKERKECLLP